MAGEGRPMTVAEAIAAGPQGGDDDFVTTYLGVPKGYTAERRTAGPPDPRTGGPFPAMVAPRYTEADIYRPEKLSVEDRARLQQQMDRAGMFRGTDKYRLGSWDETTQGAYARLLAFANQGGYDQAEALNAIGELSPEDYDALYGKGAYARSSSRKTGSVVGPGTEADIPRGIVNQAMSGEDLRYLADRTSRSSLGRKLTQDELNRFSGAYQQMLNAATQREVSANEQAAAGQNVTYAGPTDPEAFASAQMESLDPTAFGARKQLDAFKAISDMLGGL